jgi:hypothetical protein
MKKEFLIDSRTWNHMNPPPFNECALTSVHITKVRVLLIRQIIKCMHHIPINNTRCPSSSKFRLQFNFLRILRFQIKPQENKNQDKKYVTANVC